MSKQRRVTGVELRALSNCSQIRFIRTGKRELPDDGRRSNSKIPGTYVATRADLWRIDQLFDYGEGREGWHIDRCYVFVGGGGVIAWERN